MTRVCICGHNIGQHYFGKYPIGHCNVCGCRKFADKRLERRTDKEYKKAVAFFGTSASYLCVILSEAIDEFRDGTMTQARFCEEMMVALMKLKDLKEKKYNEYMDLYKAKMRERYKKKKIDGTFNDMKEQFLKTAYQRRHMKRITKHDRNILAKQTALNISNKKDKSLNTIEKKDE